jgi:UDPglucose--hexose-1-phosphate uridylyltransferase
MPRPPESQPPVPPQPDEAPRVLREPTTGRPILMAPVRQKRPMHTGDRARDWPCPFCSGNEAETPPEVDAEREPGSRADGPGWTARAFANKYPAIGDHEVIAEGSAHLEHAAELDAATWRRCADLWRRRIRALEAKPGVACTYFFKNVGALAGASLAHHHSQVLGLADLPPRIALELQNARALGHCPWCATLATAAAEQRLVFETAHHAILAPEPPKLPNETWLLPKRCDDDFLTTDLDSLAQALHALFTAVDGGLNRPAFNMWLHRAPGEAFHWHFELQPRTGQMAGLELGGDMYINSMPAATSAARLRAGLAGR